MAVNIQKEGQRLPGFNVLPTGTPLLLPVILGGNVMEVDSTDSSGGTIRLLATPLGTKRPLGVAIDSNVRSTITNGQPGAEFVTEFNRGGLIGTAHGGGAIFRLFDDGLGMPLDTTAPALALPYAVNQPIFALPVTADGSGHFTGVGQVTSLAAGAFLIGRIIKVEGSGSTLAVTFISEI